MKNILRHLLALCLLGFLVATRLSAQTVIGGTTPTPSALLDLQSTNKGFLPPRLTTTERNAIAEPATGLLVFNTTLNCIEMNVGVPAQPIWVCLSTAAGVTAYGGPGCSGLGSIQGTMNAGFPVSGVTMTLYANVTWPGIWSLSTTQNGVTFLGSGNFINPGCQPITLTAVGTPIAPGTFTWTTGTQPAGSAEGVVNCTASGASLAPTVCINTPLPDITHTTTGATGIGTPTGFPAGVTASWQGNVITISGTPEEAGVFGYSIPLEGECGSIWAAGDITVSPDDVVSSLTSDYTYCINTPLSVTTHATTGATGIGTPTGLPAGLTANWQYNTLAISGTATEAGTFNYSIPLAGGCGEVEAQGAITISDPVGCQVCGPGGTVLTFSCYNLGAVATSDPYTPRWELNGDYYLWGRATVAASGPTGPSSGEANAGAFNGVGNPGPNDSWIESIKTVNDPCPVGFRVPTKEQWDAVANISLNPIRSFVGTWAGPQSATNYSSGLRIGSGSVGLFLPATGYRDFLDNQGELRSRGQFSIYWSSMEYTQNGAWALYINNANGNVYVDYCNRPIGNPIRCIAE
jgi:uncharacterized protein (TIGR02145 family)